MRCALCLCLILGCAPVKKSGENFTPSAGVKIDSRRADLLRAIADAMTDKRLLTRADVFELLSSAHDAAGIERGKDKRLAEAIGKALNPIIGETGDADGEPIKLTDADRAAVAVALRRVAGGMR